MRNKKQLQKSTAITVIMILILSIIVIASFSKFTGNIISPIKTSTSPSPNTQYYTPTPHSTNAESCTITTSQDSEDSSISGICTTPAQIYPPKPGTSPEQISYQLTTADKEGCFNILTKDIAQQGLTQSGTSTNSILYEPLLEAQDSILATDECGYYDERIDYGIGQLDSTQILFTKKKTTTPDPIKSPSPNPPCTKYERLKDCIKADVMCHYNDDGNDDWVQPEVKKCICAIAAEWSKVASKYGMIQFGDASTKSGASLKSPPGHKGQSHKKGCGLDLRPICKKQPGEKYCDQKCTWQSANYDREATKKLIQTIKSNSQCCIKSILFNDPELRNGGLTKYYSGHDNHIHITFCGPCCGNK